MRSSSSMIAGEWQLEAIVPGRKKNGSWRKRYTARPGFATLFFFSKTLIDVNCATPENNSRRFLNSNLGSKVRRNICANDMQKQANSVRRSRDICRNG